MQTSDVRHPPGGTQLSGGIRTASLTSAKQGCNRSRLSVQIIIDLLVYIEVCIIVLSSLFSFNIYVQGFLGDSKSSEPYVLAGCVCALLTQYAFEIQKKLSIRPQHQQVEHRLRLLLPLMFSFLVVIALAYVFKMSALYSRGWFALWFVTSTGGIFLVRILLQQKIAQHVASGRFRQRSFLVASPGQLTRVHNMVQTAKVFEIVGMVELVGQPGPDSPLDHAPLRAQLLEIEHFARRSRVDVVFVGTSAERSNDANLVALAFAKLPVDIFVSPEQMQLNVPIQAISQLGCNSLLQLQHRPIGDWGLFIKDIVDYVGSAVLLLLTFPLFVAIIIALKLDNPGPVFFLQRRNGYNEREITVWKFRTMRCPNGDRSVRQAVRNDPRVTRVGAFLRKTSLDELPQLINVLRGEMSLVGPRPHALVHNDFYKSRVASYDSRHRVKPGITGLAQISGHRGNTERTELMAARICKDLEYIENWSLLLDIKILLLTPIMIISVKNAY